MGTGAKKQIECLQAGRALAAIAVCLHHAALSASGLITPVPAFLGKVLEHGWAGVDFFFVLSGFIIYHSAVSTGLPMPDAQLYARNRLLRIFAPYLPISIGLMIAYAAMPSLSGSAREWALLPSLTLMPWPGRTALSVAWTLQHELVFYAIFGLAFFTGNVRAGMIAWAAAIIAAWALGIGLAGAARFVLAPINLEFLMGIALAVLTYRSRPLHWVLPIGVALVAFAIWGATFQFSRQMSPLFGLCLAALMLPLIQAEIAGRVRVPSGLIYLGAASYSLYLVHNPLLSLTIRVARKIPILDTVGGSILFGVATSLLVGISYHELVEKPATRMLRSRQVSDRNTIARPAHTDLDAGT